MKKLKVELGKRSYPIFVGPGILGQIGEMYQLFGLGAKAAIIMDTNVQELHYETLAQGFEFLDELRPIVLDPGEASKQLRTAEQIITELLEAGFDRNCAVIGFGGGVIGDLAGFVASIYKRGVPLIQVPTTLLAQVDASVGGKTGVNHPLGKNMIGTFYQPKLIWADLTVLATLPKREMICGLAEIVKYGVIRDADLFAFVEDKLDQIFAFDSAVLESIVHRCCEIKAEIVAKDERETGLRMILNFGHTIGHALEAATNYTRFNHGEAVLLGMLAETKMAVEMKLISTSEFDRIRTLISNIWPAKDLNKIDSAAILQCISRDKKVLDGQLRFVLPKQIGEGGITDGPKADTIEAGIQFILS